MICEMGVPENAAKHALYKTGNNSPDMAVTWYFENMDDPSLTQPLMVKAGGAAAGGDTIPAEVLNNVMAMGFPEKKCRKALNACDNNPDRAVEWLFSHMDDPESDEEMKDEQVASEFKGDKAGVYNLHGFVTHLGSSIHAGHYVCHIKRDGKWIYFNDAKVASMENAPIGKGYMYFFTMKDN
jgi:ubiquitin carboxyl-terminal hydrolase 5/13